MNKIRKEIYKISFNVEIKALGNKTTTVLLKTRVKYVYANVAGYCYSGFSESTEMWQQILSA